MFIFSDGSKEEKDFSEVQATRNYIASIEGFASVNIVNREKNIGLRANVSDGITQVVNKFGKVIIVEDDLVLSPYFLDFMNDALNIYENNENVGSVNAFMYSDFTSHARNLPESFFLPLTSSWGWGTWARAWNDYNDDAAKLLELIKSRGLESKFNVNNTYNYTRMLEAQALGKIDSWAIEWYAVNFLKNRLGLFPKKTFANNIGTDGTGTHYKAKAQKNVINLLEGELVNEYAQLTKIPVQINNEALELQQNIFREMSKKPPLIFRAARKIYRILRKFKTC